MTGKGKPLHGPALKALEHSALENVGTPGACSRGERGGAVSGKKGPACSKGGIYDLMGVREVEKRKEGLRSHEFAKYYVFDRGKGAISRPGGVLMTSVA